MADIFNTLSEKYAALDGNTNVSKWTKANIEAIFKANVQAHSDLAEMLGALSDKDMKDWYQNKVKLAMRNVTSKAKSVYEDYQHTLVGKAASEERRPLGSLKKANELFKNLLTSIQRKLDDVLGGEKNLNIETLKISQMSVLGILRQSDLLINFTTYLYTFLVRAAADAGTGIPKYREMFLTKHCSTVATLVSDVISQRGAFNFLNELTAMRKEQADVVLGALPKFGAIADAIRNSNPILKWGTVALAAAATVFFGVTKGPGLFEDYKMARNNKRKEMKAWLENHITLLQMSLNEIDPSDPKYAQTMSIIKAYDEKLAEYDKQINEYEADGENL